MRIGKALRLRWTDIDLERKILVSNESEKHGKPRRFKVGEKLIGMLKSLIRRIRGSFRQPIARAPDSHHAKLHLYLEGAVREQQ